MYFMGKQSCIYKIEGPGWKKVYFFSPLHYKKKCTFTSTKYVATLACKTVQNNDRP